MTQEEQQKDFEQTLDIAWKRYEESGAAIVDALEENVQELAFAKGYNAGYKQSVEHPTGDELLYVLNKGHKQGYKDAIDKSRKFFEKRMWEMNAPDGEAYVVDGLASSVKSFIENFKKYMEEQQ